MGKKRKIINSTKYARKYANHPLARARAAAGVVAGSVVDVAEDVVEAAAEVVETVAETTAEVVELIEQGHTDGFRKCFSLQNGLLPSINSLSPIAPIP